jgi:5-formyltetrahydrofolate cyclo-ligase
VRKIGVCFEAQIVAELPLEPHDMVLDAVVTERMTNDE